NQGPDRTGHQYGIAGCFAGDSGPGEVDLGNLVTQPDGVEPGRIGPEGIGFDYLGSGGNILIGQFRNQFRADQVQMLEIAVKTDPLRVEHGADGAVTNQDFAE